MAEVIAGVTGLRSGSKRKLENPNKMEYLFISVYRARFSTLKRTELMKDIIFHIDNPDKLKTKIDLIGRFTTIFNNRILGLEVDNASVYGSKIQLSFDDFDRELSKTIRKHDIIIIHRINNRSLKMIDALASMAGLGTTSASGISDLGVKYGVGTIAKLGLNTRSANFIVNKFLEKEVPIFSGLITNPRLVISNSIKLAIEAQDMIRILQHINTEEQDRFQISEGIPKNIDEFFLSIDPKEDEKIEVKGDNIVKILQSSLLKILSEAVMDELKSFSSDVDASIKGFKFRTTNPLSEEGDRILNFGENVFIRPISHNLYLFHISPIKAIKLFIKYYTKKTGMNVFFDFDTWDTDFYQDSSIVEDIYKKIYKNSIGINPYFTYGMFLNIPFGSNATNDDEEIVVFGTNHINDPSILFGWLKKYDLQYVFTEKSFGVLREYRITETMITQFKNQSLKEREAGDDMVIRFFLSLIGINDIIPDNDTLMVDGDNLYKEHHPRRDSDGGLTRDMRIISREAREKFHTSLQALQKEFATTLSLDHIVSTNYTSVRSTEFNPILTNKLKTVPITQMIQLFLGAMTSIPVSQSKQTTGFDNTANNISQRIWLSSAIGFRKNKNDQSFYYKKGMKPVIYFGLRYEPAISDTNSKSSAIYVSFNDIVDAQMYTLPSNGLLSIYNSEPDNIRIGYSRFSKSDYSRKVGTMSYLSLGMTNSFDLNTVMGTSLAPYISENTDAQTGGTNEPKGLPRIGLFKLVDVTGNAQRASTSIGKYDDFRQIEDGKDGFWVYLGYDLYAMNDRIDLINIKYTNEIQIYSPRATSGGIGELYDLGRLLNPTRSGVRDGWKNVVPDFPSDDIVKIGINDTKKVVTGIQSYYDVASFIPILKHYKHLIDFGFKGVSGEGDKDWYNDLSTFQIYHNIKINNNSNYLETYDITRINPEEDTVKTLVTSLLKWLEQFDGNEEKKRYMMIKYAKMISILEVSDIEGDDCPIRQPLPNQDPISHRIRFHPPSLLNKIKNHEMDEKNNPAIKTIKILAGFVRSLSHYMNRIAKESVTGGVLYMPLRTDNKGQLLKIGDAIKFQNDGDSNVPIVKKLKDGLLKIALKGITKSELDLYEKTYYIWKIIYYFGGAGTDPSGTSGNTMRVYITDSGIHWQSSYEESDITTKIAEKMQLHRIAVDF